MIFSLSPRASDLSQEHWSLSVTIPPLGAVVLHGSLIAARGIAALGTTLDSTPTTLFGRIAQRVMKHPRQGGVFIALMLLVAIGLSTRLHVDPDILQLLPPDDPTTQAIQKLNNEEGGANLLVIAVEPIEQTDDAQQRVDAYMHGLEQRLSAWPEVDYALYDVAPDLAWRIGLMQLTPEELQTIRDRIKGALSLGPMAANPFVAGRLLDLGPLTQRLSQDHVSLTGDDGIARLLVRPTGSAYHPDFARPFLAKVRADLAEHPPEAAGLRLVWIGGAYRHAVEDVEGIIHDLRWTSLISMTLVLLLVGTAFRDPRALFLIFVPLVIGTTWTVGFAGLAVGTINTFTSFAVAVLIGLGVDFSIHFYSRYREERAHGGGLQDAVVRAWDQVGPPAATAALTSAGGFLALWAAGFQGFRQLGTILAGGVMLALLSVLVTLPLLILWREKQPRAVPLMQWHPPERREPPTYRFAPLGLLVIGAITIAALFALPHIQFEFDLSKLRRTGLAYTELSQGERAVAQDSFAPVVVSFDDDASLAEADTRVRQAIQDGKAPEFGRVLSIYSLLPVDQTQRLGILREISTLARDPNVTYLPAQVQKNLARIAQLPPDPMTADDLPRGLRHLLGAGEGHHRLIIIPDGNMWDLRNSVALNKAIQRWFPGRPAAGEYLATAVLYRLVQGDAPRVALAALLAVFLLAWYDLRSLGRALGAITALVVGISWAGAAMVAFGVKLSLVNFVGIPILVGIGVDVIIHLLHRMNEEGPGRIRVALATTGWAAGLSALTTILSFASLAAASNQGVQSLGEMIVIGLSLVTTGALIVVPWGWMTVWKVKGQLPGSWPKE